MAGEIPDFPLSSLETILSFCCGLVLYSFTSFSNLLCLISDYFSFPLILLHLYVCFPVSKFFLLLFQPGKKVILLVLVIGETILPPDISNPPRFRFQWQSWKKQVLWGQQNQIFFRFSTRSVMFLTIFFFTKFTKRRKINTKKNYVERVQKLCKSKNLKKSKKSI